MKKNIFDDLNREQNGVPYVTFEMSKNVEHMKVITKTNQAGIFANPISRNIALIFMGGFLTALTIVTAGVMLLNLIFS